MTTKRSLSRKVRGQQDPRRRFYPLSKNMTRTAERLKLMCQSDNYCLHEVNRQHFLWLDDDFVLVFTNEGRRETMSLRIELRRDGKPTREGLVYWWSVFDQWYAKLMEWQGPWADGGLGNIKARMRAMEENGASHTEIARWLNAELRKDLKRGTAGPLLAYLCPKLDPTEAMDTAQPVSSSKVRELLRYARKKQS